MWQLSHFRRISEQPNSLPLYLALPFSIPIHTFPDWNGTLPLIEMHLWCPFLSEWLNVSSTIHHLPSASNAHFCKCLEGYSKDDFLWHEAALTWKARFQENCVALRSLHLRMEWCFNMGTIRVSFWTRIVTDSSLPSCIDGNVKCKIHRYTNTEYWS